MEGAEQAPTRDVRTANLIMSGVLTAVGIGWCLAAGQITSRMTQGFGDAGFLPFWAGILLTIVSLGLFIAYWRTPAEIPNEEELPLFEVRGQVRVVALLILLLGYIVFLDKIHYAISTFVLMLVGLPLAGEPIRPRLFVFAALTTAFLYIVFIKVLHVQLPGSLYF